MTGKEALRLAILADYREENWPSMDLVAEMLTTSLQANHAGAVWATPVCPPLQRRFGRVPWLGHKRLAYNADRLLGRMWDYPRYLRPRVGEFDCFHICDHSYAQLVHELPAARTGVYCHDLDMFRCLLGGERRPRWFRAMARRILDGMQKAAVVFHNSQFTRQQIEQHALIDPTRLIHAPLGCASEFAPEPVEPDPADAVLGPLAGAPYLLHVGSCIPRKRIDILLEVFAGIHARWADLRLLQVGGAFTAAHEQQLLRLGIRRKVFQVRGLDRTVLAALYRRAALVLQPSEAEGFGIPVIEALACGTPVLASDIPVLREVGGSACGYRGVGDVTGWVEWVGAFLQGQDVVPQRSVRLALAQRYSWAAHARTILRAYQAL